MEKNTKARSKDRAFIFNWAIIGDFQIVKINKDLHNKKQKTLANAAS